MRTELLMRRQKLESALHGAGGQARLAQLLEDVDAALGRMDRGAFGICESCHEPIERDRLAADPLVRFCLDHMGPRQRAALEEDLALAWRIQSALLPKNHQHHGGWDASYAYQPAGAVGGDYCDLIPDGDALVFVVGDVSGKGVASSLLASHLHAMFRSLVAAGVPLRRVIEQANRIFCESTLASHYATLVCGRAGSDGSLEICNAGHCPPLWLRERQACAIEAGGLPLGMFCSTEYDAETFAFEPGHALLLYTDGLIEARNPAGEDYGMDRLRALAAGAMPCAARSLAEACVCDWTAFRSGAAPADDLTVLALIRGASLTRPQ